MPSLILLGGYATAGKDEVADELVRAYGWHKTYFSKPLEQALLALDPWVPSGRGLNGYIRYADLHAEVGYQESKNNPEVRRLLQTLGTQVGRDIIGPNTWTDIIGREIDLMFEQGYSVLVTGTRYPNEFEMAKKYNGITVWVDRLGLRPVNSHSSDNSLLPAQFDVILKNHGDLDDLREATSQLYRALILHHASAHGWPALDFPMYNKS